ncbi:hypothetical protein [Deinococcus soli (ex Cha et al. 2016)]|uniref:Uncharacterized protein n=2 Tax=Deinococcus soli (ex Cha et al. 2016) TaxID=1309411 RepID=A0AAE3XF15_9DEIO|nr:hypothetical protein [Deinococcus soli (ex Cha et al. 2016)]MDR6220860.1 hypothetical protein [Deinococcus soli (ex Cha et al. 2016)]MDR6330854.1 hypothetical protein [Deinococcus soli (ex Cha et al. 2016)]MDR6753959.1 hypothetical protein [Deinococcus soli (ex Cha et al. 2016)]
MERRIEIRLTQTEQKSYEKGKVIRMPGPDPLRIGELVRPELETAIHEKYGEDTELTFSVAQVTDVRLLGSFPEKAPAVRAWVEGLLADALENLTDVDRSRPLPDGRAAPDR